MDDAYPCLTGRLLSNRSPEQENEMKKFILSALVAAFAIPAAASAQTVESQNEQLQRAVDSGDLTGIEKHARGARKAGDELREDRDHFARQHYVAPYGDWSYSALTPGATLRPRFYASSYAVAHPDGYELRRAKRNERWVRYGDDLVLVNVRSGRVLEVASGRF
jgi:Ni/Co efflux regulator RcnB